MTMIYARKATPEELQGLLQFCRTADEHEIIRLASEGLTQEQIAEQMPYSARSVRRRIENVRKYAASRGYSPEEFAEAVAPDGYRVKGTSGYYRIDPETGSRALIGQWVKTDVDRQRQVEIMHEIVQDIVEAVPARSAVPAPAVALDGADLLNVYPITDAHIGMLAWEPETGEPWDLPIATQTITGCFQAMVDASPPARTAIVANMGDLLHYDSMRAETPKSRHLLDAASRPGAMVSAGCAIMERLIESALAKHEHVIVLIAEGNHDEFGSIYMRAMFRRLFRDDPRVSFIDNDAPFYCHTHGQCMIAFHHGHKADFSQLIVSVPAMYPREWGATRYRVCHTGDKHHRKVKEHAGLVLEQHETLAAPDAYTVRSGWLSQRRATAIVYHADYGEVARHAVSPAMLRSTDHGTAKTPAL